jgi:hypothetical protein
VEGSVEQKRLALLQAFERLVTEQGLVFFEWGFCQYQVEGETLIVSKLATYDWASGKGVSLAGCRAILRDLRVLAKDEKCVRLAGLVGEHKNTTSILSLYLALGFDVVKISGNNVLLVFNINDEEKGD